MQVQRRGRQPTPEEQAARRRRMAASGSRVRGGTTTPEMRMRHYVHQRATALCAELVTWIEEMQTIPDRAGDSARERRLGRGWVYLCERWSLLRPEIVLQLQPVCRCRDRQDARQRKSRRRSS